MALEPLTDEELVALLKSPICVKCGHRGLLHCGEGAEPDCLICPDYCDGFMEIGAFCPWHPGLTDRAYWVSPSWE